jgi:hypothetical protein
LETVSGNLAYDTVQIGNSSATGVEFLMADQVSTSFGLLPFDGILGLGFQEQAIGNVQPLLEYLYNQGNIENNSFSLYFSGRGGHNTGIAVLGGVDPTLQQTQFKYVPLYTSTNVWSVALNNVLLGNVPYLSSSMYAVLDTSFAGIMGPTSAVTKILGYFPPVLNCASPAQYPNLVFDLGTYNVTVTPYKYLVSIGGTCAIGITAYSNLNYFILGNSVLSGYYTHYDMGNNRVGFSIPNANVNVNAL